jgi:extracellular factor (EF) 3-hydroxypalmitic acid methyl ester biosynthesis protein
MESQTSLTVAGDKESFIACQTSQREEIRASLVRVTRFQAVFEICSPEVVLRMSEVLGAFKVVLRNRTVYSGKAVVSNLINSGSALTCEATLDEGWVELSPARGAANSLPAQFDDFLQEWQKSYKVLPEFKVVVADMQSLFADMRLWLDQVQLSLGNKLNGERLEIEREAAEKLRGHLLPTIDALGDQFEEIAASLDADQRPAHMRFTRRQLHPLLMCSPFGHRTYSKPLGYAGDYEMVNMIVRDPYQGSSLFAKVINAWFLNQLPAEAHRNRIKILKHRLVQESARMLRIGRPAQIFNLGCGPAGEIQKFLREEHVSDNAHFTLLDFNEETIANTGALLQDICRKARRRTCIQMVQKSVQQVLKEASRPLANSPSDNKYDFLYCAGLFDYLPDRVCKQLMNVFYQWLAPGGLLLVTNVDATRAFRNKLEFILDWNLLYRNGRQMLTLKPDAAPDDAAKVVADETAVNVFLEIRKPENA